MADDKLTEVAGSGTAAGLRALGADGLLNMLSERLCSAARPE